MYHVVQSIIKLRLIVLSTKLENREGQRKRGSRRQASEAQREKERRRASRARDKKQRRIFVGRKFCRGGEKMRNASGHRGENEGQWEKVNKITYDISSVKRVTRKFLDVSLCSRAKQR